MTPDPNTLLAPAISAFPRYSAVLSALGNIMATDAAPVASTTVPSTPPAAPVILVVPAPIAPPVLPTAVTVHTGAFFSMDGGGILCAFDFGDKSGAYNTLRGYNASHVYDAAGTFTATMTPAGGATHKVAVTVVPDTRPQVTLTATEDLSSAVAHLTQPTIVFLPTGATYDVETPITLAADGITLRASGTGAAPRIRRIATKGVYSTLIINGSDISLEGIEFDSDQPLLPANNVKVGIYALNISGSNLLVRNCTFRNVDDGLHCQSGAKNLLAVDCQFTDELRACGVYLAAMQNAAVLGITGVRSVCEHIVRAEGARNILVDGCDVNNTDGKETIAIRMGQCIAVTGNTIRAWARMSQGIDSQPGTYCTNMLFAANHFAGLRPDGPWLQVNPGCQTVWIDGNAFDVDANQGCIGLQAPSTDVKITGNQLCMTPGTTACKPLVRPFGNPVYTETGTTTIPAPGTTTIPAKAATSAPAKAVTTAPPASATSSPVQGATTAPTTGAPTAPAKSVPTPTATTVTAAPAHGTAAVPTPSAAATAAAAKTETAVPASNAK